MARTITINISDEEEKLMNDMVLDIEEWIKAGPFKEKCANHKKRIAFDMRERLSKNGVQSMPTSTDGLVSMYFADPAYKTRKQRDDLEKSKSL